MIRLRACLLHLKHAFNFSDEGQLRMSEPRER